MHELSVTQSILNIAVEAANGAGSKRVTAIDVLVGELTGFVTDSIQFYFDLLSKDTVAEGALLRFRREPASATCSACGHVFHPEAPFLPLCSACGSPGARLSGGRELRVESIEVE